MCGRSHQQVSWSKFKSFYLRVEGRTKSLTSALVQNLSPSTYRWKDEPSHSRVPWSKFKSFYLWVEGRTKPPKSALVKIKVLLPTGRRTNQVTHECLGRNLSPSTNGWKDEPIHSKVPWSKFKSSYLWVEGRTKPPASASVQNSSPSTYGWKD